MNAPAEPTGLVLNISAVEREVGLSKDVLRMWERRYGFPTPARDDNGERQYAQAEVAKLRAIRRLMDAGMRPGKLITLALDELNVLADSRSPSRVDSPAPSLEREVLACLRSHDAAALQLLLANVLMRQGLQRFVVEALVPLNQVVHDAALSGELRIFEEHLYAEQAQGLLRTAINTFPRPSGAPRVLLTTIPAEHGALGLLMVEAVLTLEGAQCISLGTQTPLDDIRRAALAHKVHLLALSFSPAFPQRPPADSLALLRRQVPPQVTIWVSGEMTRRIRKTLPGVVLMPELGAAASALRGWRSQWVAQSPGY